MNRTTGAIAALATMSMWAVPTAYAQTPAVQPGTTERLVSLVVVIGVGTGVCFFDEGHATQSVNLDVVDFILKRKTTLRDFMEAPEFGVKQRMLEQKAEMDRTSEAAVCDRVMSEYGPAGTVLPHLFKKP